MKKWLDYVVIGAIFIVGLGIMFYPLISEKINEANQTHVISTYNKEVEQTAKDKLNSEKEAAHSYNKRLVEQRVDYTPSIDGSTEVSADYSKLLNINDVMGYIKIPSIDVGLPIKHGTGEDVLRNSVGHIEGTSLPVGGESTHCLLSGHRGLPSANLFTDLDKLQIGDVFYIYVLDDVLEYKVDDISVVLPQDTSAMNIIKGKDYVTLVTCTPYGINSHRLLVRGTRIPYTPEAVEQKKPEKQRISTNTFILLSGVGVTAIIIIIMTIIAKLKKR